jgi:ATP-dependent helicase HepA
MNYPDPDFPVDRHPIQAGSLVRSRLNTLATGKVVSLSNSNAIVEYFLSVGSRIEKTISIHSLERVTLQRHTRCYFRLEDQENWQIGRIYQWHSDDRRYEIDLPNSKYCYATESEIYVRCDLPLEDPTEILIMKGQERLSSTIAVLPLFGA